jgi:hypothetical protein
MCGAENLKPVVEDPRWELDALVRSQMRALLTFAARRLLFDELPGALKLKRSEVIDLILKLHARHLERRRSRGAEGPQGRATP